MVCANSHGMGNEKCSIIVVDGESGGKFGVGHWGKSVGELTHGNLL